MKMEEMVRWIEGEWMPSRVSENLMTFSGANSLMSETVLNRFDRQFVLPGDFRFHGTRELPCPSVVRVAHHTQKGEVAHRSGAFVHRFENMEGGAVEVMVVGSFCDDHWNFVCLACVPQAFLSAWSVFSNECERISRALSPNTSVTVIGGRAGSFVPTVDWDEIVLPAKLKTDILEDVQSFFLRGVDIYRSLNLKPFRKLLLAGVPGTGKTMICTALAKWALGQGYVVIYISSALQGGSTFGKIQQALAIAAQSNYPALIILEELDAYLHQQEKALVLNVLDGSESFDNSKGTLLVATTNYPEAIDDRVLKRPGRLDRIFIIPEIRDKQDAEKMLRQYLGKMWREEHRGMVPQILGYPGAFIREVVVYALTQAAFTDRVEVSLELLERSLNGLKQQIDARDDFLHQRSNNSFLKRVTSKVEGQNEKDKEKVKE